MGNSVMLNGIEYAGEQIAYKDSTYELVSKVAYLIGVEVQSPLPEQRQELFAVLALPQRRILLCQLVELSPQLLVGVRFPVEFGGLRKGELFLLPRPVHRNCPFRAPALSSADGILPFPETA